MAGDWIPIRKDLDRCREVSILVEQTQLSVNEVVGQLVRFWCWIDGETTDGWLPGATEKTLEIASAICPQLVRTLSAVKWIEVRQDGIQVLNFEHWFGHNAKRRLADAKRKRVNRQQIEPSAKRPQLVRKTSAQKRTTGQERTVQREGTPPTPSRVPDPLVFRFEEAFQKGHGIRYPRQQPADFVQLAALRKRVDGDLTQQLWDRAVDNYFATPQKKYTLADLSVNFEVFQAHALDKYGKPVVGRPESQMTAQGNPKITAPG